ncbi:hypothetical protein SAMN05518672_102363 [Chitinophaga sp. CF118]|uniref:hypothetical protein n=1 Tax=Chitinophaga sp. CF118 TaxID=1884367 RepID=UPI0008F00BBB|nr:hypothetical protein [Chitinophaga sp. CF118]SFD54291.1 hypothetical protein SAMN05518672_102363 [Chitinophaga sp. CF118]
MNKYIIYFKEDVTNEMDKPFLINYVNEDIDFIWEGIGYVADQRIQDIPSFLLAVINKGEHHIGSDGFVFGPVIENDIVWLDKGVVKIYQGKKKKTILSYKQFYELSLQLGEKALEAADLFKFKEKGTVDDKWEQEIISAILELKELLKSK